MRSTLRSFPGSRSATRCDLSTRCPLDPDLMTGETDGEQSQGFIPENRVDIHQNARTTQGIEPNWSPACSTTNCQ